MHAIDPLSESDRGDAAGLIQLTPEESRAFFDEKCRRELGMSGTEFLRRYDAGEFDGIEEDEFGRKVIRVEMSIPFARPE